MMRVFSQLVARTGFKQLLSVVSTQFVMLLCGSATGILAARLLGPAGRGDLAAACAWPFALASLCTLGMNQAIAFRSARFPERRSLILGSALKLALMQSAVLFLLGGIALRFTSHRFDHQAMLGSILLTAAIPMWMVGGYFPSLFQGASNFRLYNLLKLMPGAIYALVLVAAALLHMRINVVSVCVMQIVGFATAFFAGLYLAHRSLPSALNDEKHESKELVRYGWKTHVANLTGMFNQRFDQMLMSILVPASQLGYYAVAVTLATGILFLPTAVGNFTISRASAAATHDQAMRMIRLNLLTALGTFLPVCIALYLASARLTIFLFGVKYAPSIRAIHILLPGIFVLGMAQVLYAAANSLGLPGLPSVGETIAAVFTLIALPIVLPRYGYIGAAAISTAAYTLSCVVCVCLFLWRVPRLRRAEITVRAEADEPSVMSAT